jgi:hypothetical protein
MGNVAQIITAVRKPQFPHHFSTGSLASTLAAGTLNNMGISGITQKVMPYAGSIYALAASINGTITSGTVTITPMINGTPQVGIATVIGTAGQHGNYNSPGARIYNFNAGDRLEVLYTTAAVLSAGSPLQVDVLTMYEAVEL